MWGVARILVVTVLLHAARDETFESEFEWRTKGREMGVCANIEKR